MSIAEQDITWEEIFSYEISLIKCITSKHPEGLNVR